MEDKGKAIPTDVYDKGGNLIKIDMHEENGDFIVQFIWDDREEQTSENREAFRKWAYRIIKQQGWTLYV